MLKRTEFVEAVSTRHTWAAQLVTTLVILVSAKACAQTTNVSVNPEADAFIREAAPANNYGRAGSLSVAGVSATNGFGLLGGRADSLVRFRLNEVAASLDTAFGNHEWFITSAALRLYETGAPNNALFNRGVGAFEVRWLASGDDWQEGTGSPNVPTMDGVSFQDLPSLLNPGRDLSLGALTNSGVDGAFTVNLALASAFVEDLRSGRPTTLHFTPASNSIGFTFLSRSDPRTTLRTALELTVAAGPPPRIASIERTGATEVAVRFNIRSNWTHLLQYRDVLPSDDANAWVNLFSAPAQPFDGQANVLDAVTNRQRFYRLNISPQ